MYRRISSSHADTTRCIQVHRYRWNLPKMLKCASLVSSSTASLLSNSFNLSISTGTFPSAWKVGRITPIPKGSNNSHPSGYRPKSVLPVVSNIIERHIKDAVETFLKSHQWMKTDSTAFPALPMWCSLTTDC